MIGSIVIPAHNEESVIRRTLAPLADLVAAGEVEVVVAANGCLDNTAGAARSVPGVRVLDLPQPSKVAALNAADSTVAAFPRMYLDADIEISPDAVIDVFAVLRDGDALAARPSFVYDTTGASWPVRAYYRARQRLPSNSAALWGAGCYALSEHGRRRFEEFPQLVADDLFVDGVFAPPEKLIVKTTPLVVRTPRTLNGLRAVLRRTYSGNRQHEDHVQHTGREAERTTNAADLARSVRSVAAFFDAAIYAAFVALGRFEGSRATTEWSRDNSSRA